MNEISIQAGQFIPRFTSVVILLSITCIIALIAKSMVFRAAAKYKNDVFLARSQKAVSIFVSWTIVMVMFPFILGAAGLDANWLGRARTLIGQLFSHWPIWMLLSVILAVVSHLIRNGQKIYFQVKSPSDSTPKELRG